MKEATEYSFLLLLLNVVKGDKKAKRM